MVDAAQLYGLVPNQYRPISLRKDYPVTGAKKGTHSNDDVDRDDFYTMECDTTTAVFTDGVSGGTSDLFSGITSGGRGGDIVESDCGTSDCQNTNPVVATGGIESVSKWTSAIVFGATRGLPGPNDDTVGSDFNTNDCQSINPVLFCDDLGKITSGTNVVDAGVTTDGAIDDTIESDFVTTGCDSNNAVFAADVTESCSSGTSVIDGVATDGPSDGTFRSDFVTTGCDSNNAVFAADATESCSSGTSVIDGVTTAGPSDGTDFVTTGSDITNSVFAAGATESGSSGTICGVGAAASFVHVDYNGVGGSASESICEGTDGTHEVFTNEVFDDSDCSNDSAFIDDICNCITDTNSDGLATNLDGCVGGERGLANDIRGDVGTVSPSTSGERHAKKVAVVKPFPQTYQVSSNF